MSDLLIGRHQNPVSGESRRVQRIDCSYSSSIAHVDQARQKKAKAARSGKRIQLHV